MATPESIAMRRTAALERATAAVDAIAGATGAAFAPFPVPTRDHEMWPAIEAEWLADTLEAIAASVKDQSVIPVEDDPLNEAPADAPEPPTSDDGADDGQPVTAPTATPTKPQDAPKPAKKSGT